MKRPPGIWMLLSAGVLWLSLQDVYGIRATALIFAKSTTTTTPPAPVANATDTLQLEAEVVTESSSESSNVTKPPLTGNPQIDYIHDPNLPKELNGYNLSSYPFYERVPDPDEIDFKCDGLHDGFYASIPYKCQVYHHCLFGTRYDFLCANYTAFDQKTFICQFVSDVDCVGSKKFWHRNDALYQAATTTTPKPLNIYTTAPPVQEQAPKGRGGGGGGKRRRPPQRRPQFDYYEYDDEYDDEYYDDRPRSRRRRPRPRPRPIYDDEYDEEYEEASYERRNRRPYNRRGGGDRRRNQNRNKNRDDVADDERPTRKKSDEESRNRDEEVNSKRKNEDKRKPIDRDEEFDEYDARPSRPRKGQRRPIEDDYEEIPSRENRPNRKKIAENDQKSEKPIVKPTTGTIYDRPRVAPRIKPPVPKNEANKYAYKPVQTKSTTSSFEDDYYEDYDVGENKKSEEPDPVKPKSSENKERKQIVNSRPKTKLNDEDDALTLTQKPKISRNKGRNRNSNRTNTQFKPLEDPVVEEKPKKNNEKRSKSTTTTTTTTTTETSEEIKLLDEEYYDYEIEKMPSSTESARNKWKTTKSATTTQKPRTTTASVKTTTTTLASNYKEQVVRIVKRPFLPSRGGNPYNSRGLQPVGLKASEVMEQQSSIQQLNENRNSYKVPPTRQSLRPKLEPQDEKEYEGEDEFEPQTRNSGTRHKIGTTRDEVLRPNVEAQNHEDGSRLRSEPQIRPSNTRQKIPEQNYEETKPQRSKFEPQTRPGDETFPTFEAPNRGATRTNLKFEPVETSAKLTKYSEPITDNENDFKPMKRPYHILRPSYDVITGYNGPRTTQKPKILEKNPLDINENEYDVTLNDALNPTLPNLPITSNTNFGNNGFNTANDYTFSAFQRPPYVSENVYQNKQPVVRQRYEAVYNTRDQYVAPSSDYKNFYTAGPSSKRGAAVATASYYTSGF